MKIKFKNGYELSFTEMTDVGNVIETYETLEEIAAIIPNFTPDNCSKITFYEDDDSFIATFADHLFGGMTIENVIDAEAVVKFKAHFAFRQKTDTEKLNELVAALQASQDLQDGAIEDLADTVYA